MTPTPPVSYWDAADAEARPWERVLRDNWEQMEIDAMFTAEFAGGLTLMERATGPLLFLLAAGLSACVIIAFGKGMGWVQ